LISIASEDREANVLPLGQLISNASDDLVTRVVGDNLRLALFSNRVVHNQSLLCVLEFKIGEVTAEVELLLLLGMGIDPEFGICGLLLSKRADQSQFALGDCCDIAPS
jgi:hypothetical protein